MAGQLLLGAPAPADEPLAGDEPAESSSRPSTRGPARAGRAALGRAAAAARPRQGAEHGGDEQQQAGEPQKSRRLRRLRTAGSSGRAPPAAGEQVDVAIRNGKQRAIRSTSSIAQPRTKRAPRKT